MLGQVFIHHQHFLFFAQSTRKKIINHKSGNCWISSLLESCRICDLLFLHSEKREVWGEGSSFQPHALYQQDPAYFNNIVTVPVGQAHWHNTHAAHYLASLCHFSPFSLNANFILKSTKNIYIYYYNNYKLYNRGEKLIRPCSLTC